MLTKPQQLELKYLAYDESRTASRPFERGQAASAVDMAESQVHRSAARIFQALADGRANELDDLIAAADREWRAFASDRNLVVKQAKKTTMGPYSGQSAARHLWINPEAMVQMGKSIREIYLAVLARPEGIHLPEWFVKAMAAPAPAPALATRAVPVAGPVPVRQPPRLTGRAKREQALQSLFKELVARGWTLRTGLKTPHATSPDGRLRLWFHPQSIHYTSAADGRHNAGDARSTGIENLVTADPGQLVDHVQRVFA